MEIKPALAAQIPEIRAITYEVWPPTYEPIIGKEQVNYMLGQYYTTESLTAQMEAGHQFIVAYMDDKAVAFASYSELEPGIYKLHKLYALPAMQGKGIGKAMTKYIVAKITANSGAKLRVNVNIHNTRAIEFYLRTGYRHLHDEDIDIGEGYYMNDHVYEMSIERE